MREANFILREPLLDPKQKVLGYELTLQQHESGESNVSEAAAASLLAVVRDRLTDGEAGWLLGDHLLFVPSLPQSISEQHLQGLPPNRIVLVLDVNALVSAEAIDAVKSARASGFGVLLRGVDLAVHDKALVSLATHVEAQFGNPNFSAQVKNYSPLKQLSIRMTVRKVSTWQEYDLCASLGLDVFIGNLYLTARSGTQPKGLNPTQTMIMQLMDMVRKNSDVRQLEGLLKRDAALSYKLLRYINSAGFGLGVEIQSLRHAVTMLGYSPLYRWLSVLLATASAGGASSILMQAAITRGRFAELLGQGFLPKSEVENLFVAGMFSLLDKLLGIPMAEVLDNIQLSEAVSQALLTREGIYGPFLALAEACELNNGQVGPLADAVFIDADQVNEAHLTALAWVQSLKL